MKRFTVFVSSVQKELASERVALRDYLSGDALLRRYFDTFLFEDLPAKDQKAEEAYLEDVRHCDIYLGIFGDEYGWEDADGLSPTEREFDAATQEGKARLIFVKGTSDSGRHPKMEKLLSKASSQLIRRRFHDIPDLMAEVYASLVDFLESNGCISQTPFDASRCAGATMRDISPQKLRWFLGIGGTG